MQQPLAKVAKNWLFIVNFCLFSVKGGLIVGRTASAPIASVRKQSRGVHKLSILICSTEPLKPYLIIFQCVTLIAPDFSGLLTIVSIFRSLFLSYFSCSFPLSFVLNVPYWLFPFPFLFSFRAMFSCFPHRNFSF